MKKITLDCGIEVETYTYKKCETIRIDLSDLLNGYGTLANLDLLSKIFLELHEKGFKTDSISHIEGYYGAIDAIYLDVKKVN